MLKCDVTVIAISGFEKKKVLETANILKKNSDDFEVVTGRPVKRKYPLKFYQKPHGADKDLIIYTLSIEKGFLAAVKALIRVKTPRGVLVELLFDSNFERKV